MRSLLVFCALAPALLGSATPRHPRHRLPIDLASADGPVCAGSNVEDCTELADGSGGIVAAATPETPIAPPTPPAFPAPAVDLGQPPPQPNAQPTAQPAPRPTPPTSDVRVLISLPQQRAYVFQGDELFGTSPVSTGRRGHETPVGIFHILEKQVHHRSNKYSNAPMPFMERLTMSGIALHAGHLPGYPASHGCIRMPWAFAKKLYSITSRATQVTITRERPRSADDAFDLI